MKRRLFLTMTAVAALAACGTFKVSYPAGTVNASDYKVTGININIPEALVVSSNNELNPKADIVWWEGENVYGKDTVKEIFNKAVSKGVAGTRGSRPVKLAITLIRFHGMTAKATRSLQVSGVHNVQFYAQLFDANTGQKLTEPAHIFADVPALHGQQLANSINSGATDRVRVTNQIAAAVAGWLGTGSDARTTFSRIGS